MAVKTTLVNLKLFLILTLISSAILLLDYFNLMQLPKSALSYLSAPIQYGLYRSAQGVRSQFKSIFLARLSAQENAALKNQLAQLLSENSQLKTKLSEAEKLIDQNSSLSPKTFDLIPARTIGLGRYLLIDKGSNDGIKSGQLVVFKDNYVGVIKMVSPKSSQVILSSDPDSKVAVFTQNSAGKAKGLLVGRFGSESFMDKVLHAESIKEGDLVYSDGTDGLLPRGLILGKVTQVIDQPNAIFKVAKVKAVFDASDLEVVFVMKV